MNVIQTEIGDFSLDDLKEFERLRRLVLTKTAVTESGITALKEALPKCEVVR